MFIQIDNAGFYNKGAELMLQAIIRRLNQESTLKPKFVAGNGCSAPDKLQIRKAGLYQIPNLQRFKIKWQNYIDQERLETYGLTKRENVNTLLDSGGFHFGDQWTRYYSKRTNLNLQKYYHSYKKNKTTIIFLPQAFGPFENELAKDRIKIAYEYANIIYAREKTSLSHLQNIFGESQKIKLAPDFTSLLEPIEIIPKKDINDSICLIPNAKMIEFNKTPNATNYINFLLEVSDLILKKNIKLILLNHEGIEDWKLINQIQNKLQNKSHKILTHNDLSALEIKRIIGQNKMIISSRFHGVVSGLNQHVATLCTSWSHKYEELLDDYKTPQNLLNINDTITSLAKVADAIEHPEHYTPNAKVIMEMKNASKKMWNEIIQEMHT